MKQLRTVLAGWLVFIVGHSGVIAVRARVLAARMEHFQAGKPAAISDATFWTVDAVLLAIAGFLIVVGTVGLFNKPRWRLLLALLLLAAQFALAFVLFICLGWVVHLGVGGPC